MPTKLGQRIACEKVSQLGYSESGGGRVGTFIADESVLREKFGEPTDPRSMDGKVTKVWTFATPRGVVNLRDYWWNGPTEWSIAAKDRRAARWLRSYLLEKFA